MFGKNPKIDAVASSVMQVIEKVTTDTTKGREEGSINSFTPAKVTLKGDIEEKPEGKKPEETPARKSIEAKSVKSEETVQEVSPPGFKGTAKAMKKHKDITNPFALAWSMKNKGYKSHKKADGTAKNEEAEQIDEVLVGKMVKGADGKSKMTQVNISDDEYKKHKEAQDAARKKIIAQRQSNRNSRMEEEVEQFDEAEMKTKTAYVPYVYTDRHGSGFGGYDVHYSKESDAHAHLARHGHMDINGKKGWVEKHEIAKHPSGRWVDANHMRRHNVHEETVEEGIVDTLKKGVKALGKALGGPDDEGHKKDLQRKMGIPQTGKPSMAKQNEETVEEGWDDMVKDAKERMGSAPKPNGGSGKKQGSAYGGSKQKDKPEHDVKEGYEDSAEDKAEDKKEAKKRHMSMKEWEKSAADKKEDMKEAKTLSPGQDDAPFDAPMSTTPRDVKDKSGAVHTPMSRARNLARAAMSKIKKDHKLG